MYIINCYKDEEQACINKLFNNIQSVRVDLEIIRGKKNKYPIDNDLINIAESLVRELKKIKEINDKK